MNRIPVTFRIKFENGDFKFLNALESTKFNMFFSDIKENEIFDITYESVNSDHSYAQLSKVHKLIRELAGYTGMSFDEIKDEVKKRAGLYTDTALKSFADCSKDELSLAIQSCIEIGDDIGFSLH
jgi:hypothetical protein